MFRKFTIWLFGPPSRFKVGDSVQLSDGGELMIVQKIHTGRKYKEPIIECMWTESDSGIRKTNIFPESKLSFFNWDYKPEKREQRPPPRHAFDRSPARAAGTRRSRHAENGE